MFIKGIEPISLSFGADGGNRTHNLSLTRRLLYLPWATSAKFNLFNFSALTTRKNKICFYPIIFFISHYNLLNKCPRVTTEKFVKKIFHITLLFWWAGKDSNLRHPAPKAIWKLLFNCFTRVDYLTVLYQLSYPPIFNWWGEMGSNHPSVIRTGFTDRTASTYGISPHNSGFCWGSRKPLNRKGK